MDTLTADTLAEALQAQEGPARQGAADHRTGALSGHLSVRANKCSETVIEYPSIFLASEC